MGKAGLCPAQNHAVAQRKQVMTELARLVSTLGAVSWSSWTMQVLQTVVTGRHPGMKTKSCFPGIPDKRGESSRAFSDQPRSVPALQASPGRQAKMCWGLVQPPQESEAPPPLTQTRPPASNQAPAPFPEQNPTSLTSNAFSGLWSVETIPSSTDP